MVRVMLAGTALVSVLTAVPSSDPRHALPLTRQSAGVAPDACQLLTAQDAAKLAGFDVVRRANSGGISCRYGKVGEDLPIHGVEITVRQEANAGAAHADFPRWVIPFPPVPAGMTVTPVPSLGDEASITHAPPDVGVDGIYFRTGAVLVKIGAHPPVVDAALMAAASTVVARIR
jgi:hypothetical protein